MVPGRDAEHDGSVGAGFASLAIASRVLFPGALTMRLSLLVPLACLGFLGCSQPPAVDAPVSVAPDLTTSPAGTLPVSTELAQNTMNVTYVKLETTKGDVIIEVHPDWAPNGAKRFLELVENDFYDGVKFFRVLEGFMAQTGINGDPAVHAQWRDKNIKDDTVAQSNTRGLVTFAQTAAPNSRSTQFFINYGDNSFLDGQRFAPFGKVVEGMDIVDSLYGGYGEGAPGGNGPSQGRIVSEGNAYLDKQFPKLDAIKSATVLEDYTAS